MSWKYIFFIAFKKNKGEVEKGGETTESNQIQTTTTGFGQKTDFWTTKIKSSETLMFFLSDVFFRRVKRVSYESIFWRSYGVRSATFWSICRVWGKISLRGHQNQLHGYIVLQST
jgi:hypothetical protein